MDVNLVERGKRFKLCRTMAGKSLRELAVINKMSYSNLAQYERGKLLISEKNVERFLNMLLSENIFCSKEWLLSGEGEFPRHLGSATDTNNNKVLHHKFLPDISGEFLVFNELELFKSNNPKALVKCVSDDSMFPLFDIGDYVGGIPVDPSFYTKLNGYSCIIEFPNSNQLIRKFFIDKNKVMLIAKNLKSKYNPTLEDISGINIYPIIYHRKVFKF